MRDQKLWMRSPTIVLSAGDRTPTPKGHYTTDCICTKLQKMQTKAQGQKADGGWPEAGGNSRADSTVVIATTLALQVHKDVVT